MSAPGEVQVYDAHSSSPEVAEVIRAGIRLLDHPEVLPREPEPDFPDDRAEIGDKRVYWVAKTILEEEGEVTAIAVARVELEEFSLFIHQLGVHPDFRRRGIAEKEIMPAVIELALNNSCDYVWLYAVEDEAKALYSKLGFTAHGDTHILELAD